MFVEEIKTCEVKVWTERRGEKNKKQIVNTTFRQNRNITSFPLNLMIS